MASRDSSRDSVSTSGSRTGEHSSPFDNSIEELVGDFRQIGLRHGKNNAARMRYLLSAFEVNAAAPWDETALLAPLDIHLPELRQEIDGIAEGSELGLRKVCALSFLADLWATQSACTGVAFGVGPDGPVVGKTCDCTPGAQEQWLRPRCIRPTGALAAVTYSHVGTPNAEMGMNERGLAIGVSGCASLAADPEGVGWQQDVRGVLHRCATAQQAIDMLRAVSIRGYGYCLVLGDDSGDVAVVEKVVGALAVRRPNGNVVYEANIPLTPEVLAHVPADADFDNGRARMALLDHVCRDESHMDFSLEGMLSLFATHADPVGLCQHGPALQTNLGFFMLPQKRQVWLARGNTCQRNLEKVQL
ncbi:MAG TPA: hypothetical protein HPP83_02040 [Candidatus Hydrogenedentes bacterium]|nr:hypothetical protein [Candidatus Hydrogenedentota bacterium]